ncbi:hypothetical protein J6590_023063 [Homalodisca vitripennis]|nr:hypothetical protein J6590_023063 [Homalodisca vitripennis]
MANETSLVSLKLLEKGKRVQEVYYSRPYTLRADISRPDGKGFVIQSTSASLIMSDDFKTYQSAVNGNYKPRKEQESRLNFLF